MSRNVAGTAGASTGWFKRRPFRTGFLDGLQGNVHHKREELGDIAFIILMREHALEFFELGQRFGAGQHHQFF